MKTLNLFLLFLLFFSVNSYSLPKCEGDWILWDNCEGTLNETNGLLKGHEYVGEWKDSNMHGKGTYTWPSGDKYVGEWKIGQFNGKGIYTSGSGKYKGDVYEGQFKNGNRDGYGTYTFADGTKIEGQWKNGRLVDNN